MIEPSSMSPTERELLLDFVRQRRLRLLRAITPAFLIVASIVLAIMVAALVLAPINGMARRGLLFTAILLVAIDVFLVAGLLALRAGRINLATAFVGGISAAGAVGSLAVWGTSAGLDLFAILELTPFSVLILLAGLVGSRRTIVVATVGVNAATVALLFLLTPSPSVASNWHEERLLILSVALVYQWMFSAIMIVIWSTFARTLTEIRTAYERATQLDSLKDAFISSVNHELRTPLMTMLTYLETVRERPDALPRDQLIAVLEQVCRVGEDLSDLVQSILGSRQLDQEAADFEPALVAVLPVVRAAIRDVDGPYSTTAVAEERDLHLRVSESVTVWGDSVRLQQVLTNLLANALKYSDAGTSIEISAEVIRIPSSAEEWAKAQQSRKDGDEQKTSERGTVSRGRRSSAGADMTEIIVKDYGRGIPPEQAPLLFNRFVRLPRDLASNISGNGLGLYLCRLYVEAMGGRIWVSSSGKSGGGSAFHLLLPATSPGSVAKRGGRGGDTAQEAVAGSLGEDAGGSA